MGSFPDGSPAPMKKLTQHTTSWFPFACLLAVVGIGIGLAATCRDRHAGLPTAPGPGQSTRSFPRTLPSASGEDLVLSRQPSRIIALSLPAEEILLDLAGPSRLVAVTPFARDPHFSNVVSLASEISEVVRSNPERILRLQPDLVFVASYTEARNRDLLRRSGIPVCQLPEFRSIDSIRATVRLVGHALGLEEAADALIAGMDRTLLNAAERVEAARAQPGFTPPRILFVEMPGGGMDGAWTAGAKTILDEIIRAAGGINVAAEAGVVHEGGVSAEALVHWNPSWLLLAGDPAERRATLAALSKDTVLCVIEAIREERVVLVPNRITTSTSHFCLRAVSILVDELYPEAR